jgi:hypothetical protein
MSNAIDESVDLAHEIYNRVFRNEQRRTHERTPFLILLSDYQSVRVPSSLRRWGEFEPETAAVA